jgi:hypothetical protein
MPLRRVSRWCRYADCFGTKSTLPLSDRRNNNNKSWSKQENCFKIFVSLPTFTAKIFLKFSKIYRILTNFVVKNYPNLLTFDNFANKLQEVTIINY